MYPQVNPIARNWCHAKKVCRQYVNGTTICLREHVPKSLEAALVDVNKFFRMCRDYEMAYRSGCTGKDVEITDFDKRNAHRIRMALKWCREKGYKILGRREKEGNNQIYSSTTVGPFHPSYRFFELSPT